MATTDASSSSVPPTSAEDNGLGRDDIGHLAETALATLPLAMITGSEPALRKGLGKAIPFAPVILGVLAHALADEKEKRDSSKLVVEGLASGLAYFANSVRK